MGIGGGKTVHYNLSFDELAERENAAGVSLLPSFNAALNVECQLYVVSVYDS